MPDHSYDSPGEKLHLSLPVLLTTWLAPLLAMQALPIDTVSDLLRLGGWACLLLFALVFLWALFRSQPFLFPRGEVLALRGECDQLRVERDKERAQAVIERERADRWQGKFEETLIQQIVDMKDRDRVIELLTRERGG